MFHFYVLISFWLYYNVCALAKWNDWTSSKWSVLMVPIQESFRDCILQEILKRWLFCASLEQTQILKCWNFARNLNSIFLTSSIQDIGCWCMMATMLVHIKDWTSSISRAENLSLYSLSKRAVTDSYHLWIMHRDDITPTHPQGLG